MEPGCAVPRYQSGVIGLDLAIDFMAPANIED